MNKLEINGFKSIKSLALDLKMINIFIGANGSGKSNLLSFIDMLKNIYNHTAYLDETFDLFSNPEMINNSRETSPS